jgi:Arc/MetJ-type ribon-helix-helix transcriptional regulator
MPTTQIAVRIDQEQLDALDQLIAQGEFDSRADAVRIGLAAVMRAARSRRIDTAIVAGYERLPPTSHEQAAAEAALRDAIAEEPW